MAKNIVLCSDGTGNQGGYGRDTNVWRLYKALDLHNTRVRQIAFYDDGVGTANSLPMKVLGKAFGWGLSRNVRQLYTYLAAHYEPEDTIYIFGYSRGAFTARLLANLIDYCGVPNRESWKSRPHALSKIVEKVYDEYQASFEKGDGKYNPADGTRKWEQDNEWSSAKVQCLGVWDTVNAAGAPVDEIRHFLPAWVQNDSVVRLPASVYRGYHALAIDEERKTFSPTLWEESGLLEYQKVEQVWFAGVHANVGGGYPKDGMALVSLDWMMSRIEDTSANGEYSGGLVFQSDVRDQITNQANVSAKQYDSRAGVAVYYRYAPRDPVDLTRKCATQGSANQAADDCPPSHAPLVHASVFNRINLRTDFYAPTSLTHFRITDNAYDGDKQAPVCKLVTEYGEGGEQIGNSVDNIGHYVRSRKLLYFVFLVITLFALATPWLGGVFESWGLPAREGLSWIENRLLGFFPDAATRWLEAILKSPVVAIALVLLFLGFRKLKFRVERKMRDEQNDVWHNLSGDLLQQITDASALQADRTTADTPITIPDMSNTGYKPRGIPDFSGIEKMWMQVEQKVTRSTPDA